MKRKMKTEAIFAASGDVVVRTVENQMIIIPFASGVDDSENEPFFLNETGQIIWLRLDGRKTLKEIALDLAAEFEAPVKVIEKDVSEFVEKLLVRKMIVYVPGKKS